MRKPPYPIVEEVMDLPEVKAMPPNERERAARIALAGWRRKKMPTLRTWTMSDPAPSRDEWVLGVVDGDGSLWRAKPGVDVWTLEESPRMPGAGATYTWPEMLAEFGPVTEPPADWRPQRTEVVDAVRGAVVEMDDLLFHELGAHRLGADIPDGWTTEHSSDADLISKAEFWAERLRKRAQQLDDAISQATLLHKDPAPEEQG